MCASSKMIRMGKQEELFLKLDKLLSPVAYERFLRSMSQKPLFCSSKLKKLHLTLFLAAVIFYLIGHKYFSAGLIIQNCPARRLLT
jgi:hypothetical protein